MRRTAFRRFLSLGLLLAALPWLSLAELQVTFFPNKSGASALIQADGEAMLVDAQGANGTLDVLARRYIEAAELTNPNVRIVGVSLNTSSLDEAAAQAALREAEAVLGVPAFDPIRTSADPIIDRLLSA